MDKLKFIQTKRITVENISAILSELDSSEQLKLKNLIPSQVKDISLFYFINLLSPELLKTLFSNKDNNQLYKLPFDGLRIRMKSGYRRNKDSDVVLKETFKPKKTKGTIIVNKEIEDHVCNSIFMSDLFFVVFDNPVGGFENKSLPEPSDEITQEEIDDLKKAKEIKFKYSTEFCGQLLPLSFIEII